MKTSASLIASLVLSVMLPGLNARAAVSLYTFENLVIGNVAGQDGWIDSPGNPPGAAAFIVSNGTGADTTKVFGTAGSTGSNFAWRPNDANFSFGNLSGSPTLILGFDGQFAGGGSDQIHFNLRNATGTAASPRFGYEGNGFIVGITTVALPGTVNPGDWVRMRLALDMNLNLASLSYQNITDGETLFTAVSGLQNLPVNPMNPALWSEMLVRTGFYAGNKIDNLSIEPVPEPCHALLASLGLVGLMLRRRRA